MGQIEHIAPVTSSVRSIGIWRMVILQNAINAQRTNLNMKPVKNSAWFMIEIAAALRDTLSIIYDSLSEV